MAAGGSAAFTKRQFKPLDHCLAARVRVTPDSRASLFDVEAEEQSLRLGRIGETLRELDHGHRFVPVSTTFVQGGDSVSELSLKGKELHCVLQHR